MRMSGMIAPPRPYQPVAGVAGGEKQRIEETMNKTQNRTSKTIPDGSLDRGKRDKVFPPWKRRGSKATPPVIQKRGLIRLERRCLAATFVNQTAHRMNVTTGGLKRKAP